jgi:ABC-type transport system involved in multi-copper enzyme maturation permease subunit
MNQVVQTLPPGHYRLRQVLKSEVIKVLTLPSTAITLGMTIAFALLITGLVTGNAHTVFGDIGFDSTQDSLTGMIVAGLTGGVFGALLITAEYSTGTIRASLAATPRRPVLLTAKVAVTALATVVFCEILSFVTFFLGQAILSGRGLPSASLGSAGAFRAVVMTGLSIALLALMAFGFGLICRNTAAAIAVFVGVVFVLPLVMHAISESAVRYLPTSILTNSIMSTVNQGGGPGGFGPLAPGVGLGLMAIYAAISVGAGAVLFVKRDV